MNLGKYIIFFIPITIASIIYAVANFKESNNTNVELKDILLFSIFFAIIEYLIKIPAFHYVRESISPITIHIIWIFTTFISVMLFQKLYLKKKTNLHTIIIGILVSILIGLELYLAN